MARSVPHLPNLQRRHQWKRRSVIRAGAGLTALAAFAGVPGFGSNVFASQMRRYSAEDATIVVAPGGSDSNRGTFNEPMASISGAARRARQGDVILIRPGDYAEQVTVHGQGRHDRPIVLVAEESGSVKLRSIQPDDWMGDDDTSLGSGNHWVTLQGLVFTGEHDGISIRASSGWTMLDCLVEEASYGINIRGHQATIENCTFRDIEGPDAHAIVGVGGRNIVIRDTLIERVNATRQIDAIPRSAVTKFLHTRGLLIESLVSRDNVGPGLWLDWDNENFIIRNSEFINNQGDQYRWEGPGLWLEGNPEANGEVTGNRFVGNSGSGVGILESNGIRVHDNYFADNGTCVELRNLDRGDDSRRVISDIEVVNNMFDGWRDYAVATSVGEWSGFDPQAANVVFNRNRYAADSGSGVMDWLDTTYSDLAAVRADLPFEREGSHS